MTLSNQPIEGQYYCNIGPITGEMLLDSKFVIEDHQLKDYVTSLNTFWPALLLHLPDGNQVLLSYVPQE